MTYLELTVAATAAVIFAAVNSDESVQQSKPLQCHEKQDNLLSPIDILRDGKNMIIL